MGHLQAREGRLHLGSGQFQVELHVPVRYEDRFSTSNLQHCWPLPHSSRFKQLTGPLRNTGCSTAGIVETQQLPAWVSLAGQQLHHKDGGVHYVRDQLIPIPIYSTMVRIRSRGVGLECKLCQHMHEAEIGDAKPAGQEFGVQRLDEVALISPVLSHMSEADSQVELFFLGFASAQPLLTLEVCLAVALMATPPV